MKLSLSQQIAQLQQRIQTLTALGKNTAGLRRKLARLLRRLGPRAAATGIAAPIVMLVAWAVYNANGGSGSNSSGGAVASSTGPGTNAPPGVGPDPTSLSDSTDSAADVIPDDTATGSGSSGTASGGSSASASG